MNPKLKIGVVGCAAIANKSVIPAIKLLNQFELIAVASRTKRKAVEFGHQFNCEAIFGYQNIIDRPDIDALYIPLPTGLHEEWAIKALHSGKHVLLEKSLAIDIHSAKRMVNLAAKNNLLLMENFMFLYHEQYRFVNNLINKCTIGKITALKSSFCFPKLDANNFRYSKVLGGGALLDAGAYTVKVAQLFLEGELSVQQSFFDFRGSEVDIEGKVSLINNTGISADLFFGFNHEYQCNYTLTGEKGSISSNKAFTPGSDYKVTITVQTEKETLEHHIDPDNHFKNLLTEFLRCIRENDKKVKYNEILAQSKLITEIRNCANLVHLP